MRHYLNLRILWAILTEFKTVGPFELNWETQQYKCWISQYITFGLLSSLQAINLIWLFLILRIAKNYVISNVKKDERSENEDEDEDEDGVEAAPDDYAVNDRPGADATSLLADGNGAMKRNTFKENRAPGPLSTSNGHNGTSDHKAISSANGKKRN